jgi:hypothetical protein
MKSIFKASLTIMLIGSILSHISFNFKIGDNTALKIISTPEKTTTFLTYPEPEGDVELSALGILEDKSYFYLLINREATVVPGATQQIPQEMLKTKTTTRIGTSFYNFLSDVFTGGSLETKGLSSFEKFENLNQKLYLIPMKVDFESLSKIMGFSDADALISKIKNPSLEETVPNVSLLNKYRDELTISSNKTGMKLRLNKRKFK